MSKYLDLAKKLKALADAGVGGEKTNATEALKKLMENHGITESDINGDELVYYSIKVDKSNMFENMLFGQICYFVFESEDFDTYSDKSDKTVRVVHTTYEKAIQIECMYEFYLPKFKEQLNIFYSAFVMKNDLYPPCAKKNRSEFSEHEIEEQRKASRLAIVLEKSEYKKQIS